MLQVRGGHGAGHARGGQGCRPGRMRPRRWLQAVRRDVLSPCEEEPIRRGVAPPFLFPAANGNTDSLHLLIDSGERADITDVMDIHGQ